MARKRGNPNWGIGRYLHIPATPSEFETVVTHLGLTQHMYTTSDRLRKWCERNRNRCYIPEWLLKAWEIPVDPDYGRSRMPRSVLDPVRGQRRSHFMKCPKCGKEHDDMDGCSEEPRTSIGPKSPGICPDCGTEQTGTVYRISAKTAAFLKVEPTETFVPDKHRCVRKAAAG